MRKQYYFRPSPNGYYAWDVDRLVELAKDFPTRQIPLAEITELDRRFQLEGSCEVPTFREIAEHAQLIIEADLRFPIIVSADGAVMDGMHRVMKSLIEARPTIEACVFTRDPAPDYVDVFPDDLPY